MPLDLVMGVIDSEERTEKSFDEFVNKSKITLRTVMESHANILECQRRGERRRTIFVSRKRRFE